MAVVTVETLKSDMRVVITQMQAMNTKAQAAGLGFTAEEEKSYAALDKQMKELQDQIDTQNKQSLGTIAGGKGLIEGSSLHTPNTSRTVMDRSENRRDFMSMFYKDSHPAQVSTAGFKDMHEFFSVLSSNKYDPRLEIIRAAATTSVPSDGGFLIPPGFASQILDISLESEIVRPRARIWPMVTESLSIPGHDDFDHSSGILFGGFSSQWLAEGSTGIATRPKYRSIQLNAKKIALFSDASRELTQSGLTFESQLLTSMIMAMGWHLDYSFIQGDGVGKPLGILNAPSLITVAKEVGQAASTIVYTNLAKMFSRLHPSCLTRSTWICNSGLIPQLLELSIPIGTAGSHVPVLTESADGFKILTRPVVFTEKANALGSLGDIILSDISQYSIGMRQELMTDRSNAPGFMEDVETYRTTLRVDGQPTWSKVFTPLHGDTQSWAVTLAERA